MASVVPSSVINTQLNAYLAIEIKYKRLQITPGPDVPIASTCNYMSSINETNIVGQQRTAINYATNSPRHNSALISSTVVNLIFHLTNTSLELQTDSIIALHNWCTILFHSSKTIARRKSGSLRDSTWQSAVSVTSQIQSETDNNSATVNMQDESTPSQKTMINHYINLPQLVSVPTLALCNPIAIECLKNKTKKCPANTDIANYRKMTTRTKWQINSAVVCCRYCCRIECITRESNDSLTTKSRYEMYSIRMPRIYDCELAVLAACN